MLSVFTCILRVKINRIARPRQNPADSDDRQLTLRHRETLSNSFIFEGIRRKYFPLEVHDQADDSALTWILSTLPSKFKSYRKFFARTELFNLKLPRPNFLITSLENEGQKFRG